MIDDEEYFKQLINGLDMSVIFFNVMTLWMHMQDGYSLTRVRFMGTICLILIWY